MAPRVLKRDSELSARPQVRKQLLELFADVQEGFENQRQRSDAILDNWDIYNQVFGDGQFYNGNSQIYLPYVHDAVEARKTRFTNQIFPDNQRYIEVTSTSEDLPQATTSLLDHYVRKAKLRTQVVPGLCVNGDVEGQYSVYVSWSETSRTVARKQQRADVDIEGLEVPDLGTTEHIEESKETLGRPVVEVLHDADLLILPITADSVDDAIDDGGSVTVIRRWTKARIRKAVRDGDIVEAQGEILLKSMAMAARDRYRSAAANIADAAGVKDRGKTALVYETWSRVKIDGNWRLVVTFYGGDDNILGCRPCPYWCDKVPVLSVPVKKLAGVFKGKPPVDHVADLQIFANDTINEAADTAHFSAMPIVMTDPEKNPKVSSMVLGLAAVWETSPSDTQFAQFPQLWADGLNRAAACQQQIFQTLGVNTSMIPQGGGGDDSKQSQAQIAQEQQVDLMTTADAVTVLEEGILTPLAERFAEYDHQFRDEALTIKVYGELGIRAQMEQVPMIQLGERWEFTWFGVEQSRDAARVQQQIAGMNVIKGVPPQMYPGYKINLAPLLTRMAESLFGPDLAPLVFVQEAAISVDPHLEDEMMENGFRAAVHDADDDMQHLMVHMGTLKAMGGVDPHGTFREHIQMHQAAMLAKESAQQMQKPQGQVGSPGGAGQPGAAGAPAPGGMVEGPNQMKGPPGMIHPDEMAAAGATPMPRNM